MHAHRWTASSRPCTYVAVPERRRKTLQVSAVKHNAIDMDTGASYCVILQRKSRTAAVFILAPISSPPAVVDARA